MTGFHQIRQNICVMRFLFPRIFGNRLNPWTVGLALCWQSSLVVFLGYLLILPFALLGGLNLVGTTLAYLAEVFPALSPVIEVLLSHWLFYSYFHYIITSLVGFALQGDTLAVLTILALTPLAILLGNAAAWGMFDLAIERLPAEYFHKTDPQDVLSHRGKPTLLYAGWTHGHHPAILYE